MTFSTACIISFDLNTLVNEFGRAEINILIPSPEKLRLREVQKQMRARCNSQREGHQRITFVTGTLNLA